MRVVLVGASGLIGTAVAARLKQDGHEIVGVGRGSSGGSAPVDHWIRLDLRQAVTAEAWAAALAGGDAVVNCAGVLQDNLRDSTTRVHRDAPTALWQACEEAVVPRVVQMSARGAGGLDAGPHA